MRANKGRALAAAWAAALLAGAAGPARAADLALEQVLQLALAQNPDIAVQRAQIDVAHGQQLQAAAQFDWTLASGVNYGKTVTALTDSAQDGRTGPWRDRTELIASGYQAGLVKQLRNGATVSSTVQTTAAQELSDPQPQQNRVQLNVALTLPLLKGAGNAAVTAPEQAATLTVQAERYGWRDRVAQTLYRTLQAYWSYRASVELETVAADSARRSASLLASIQTLVDAAERPRADLVLLRADLADKQAARDSAALARRDAQTALGRLLGLELGAIASLPAPAGALPGAAPLAAGAAAQGPAIGTAALARRPDLQALDWQLQAARRQLDAAHNSALPQLDLQTGLEYAKVSEGGARYGMATTAGRYQSSPTVYARLNLQLPLAHSQGRGAVQEKAALVAQLALRQRDLRQAVAAGVDSALQALLSSAARIGLAQQALALYELAVRQEVTKQQNGIATLIDVISTEARYEAARVNLLQLQLAQANAMARLRFESGTLLPPVAADAADADHLTLEANDLAGLGPLAASLTQPN